MKLVCVGPEKKNCGYPRYRLRHVDRIAGLRGSTEDGRYQENFDNTVAIHPTASEEFVTMRCIFVRPSSGGRTSLMYVLK